MAHQSRTRRPSPRRQRQRKGTASCSGVESLRSCFDWFLGDLDIFAKVRLHGNISWTASSLVILALCWSWSEARFVTDAFADAATWSRTLLGHSVLTTYQGFMGALATWTPSLMPLLIGLLQKRMAQVGGKFYCVDGYVPIAFDGSRSTAPRTRSNEAAFCAKHYGQGTTAKYRKKKSKGMRRKQNQRHPAQAQEPQVWITMLWHMGLRLPWDWELGPTSASERDHVETMLERGSFPASTLLCGDAGFVGYPFWSRMDNAGLKFLVRVGGNVRLLSEHANFTLEKKAHQEHRVLCWSKAAQTKDQRPLRLRLAYVCVGKTWMWLLTNELDRHKLTRKMMVRFYQRRWGVEVEFRGLKQTLDRAKLRCRNSQRLRAELTWSILAMAVAELLAVKEQVARRAKHPKRKADPKSKPYDPGQRSLASTMRAIRGCLKHLTSLPEPGEDLASLLGQAVADSYQRTQSKKARYRPPNPDKKPLGDPKIRSLDQEEKRKLMQHEQQKAT